MIWATRGFMLMIHISWRMHLKSATQKTEGEFLIKRIYTFVYGVYATK